MIRKITVINGGIDNMSNLKLEINQIKNITNGTLEFPIEQGIYCLAGSNGCGKSTVMSCLAQLVFSSSLNILNSEDFSNSSYVKFSYGAKQTTWSYNYSQNKWRSDVSVSKRLHFNGMYEGSLFYGTRFNDSLIVDELVKTGTISLNSIVEADEYIKQKLSFILHGDLSHYQALKRVRNKNIAKEAHLKNTPYFQVFNNNPVSQYRMSSGECLLISLLHFIYNALIRRSLPDSQPILMLIDEIELALHPVAISRLIDLLYEIIEEHDNLTVILTSHSPEVIHKINSNNLFVIESTLSNNFDIINPCYPSYAIRDVYIHDGFDYVILVEDMLAKYIVDTIIKKAGLNSSKLINILPIGGWENVLKFQHEANITNTFGIGTKVFSILDGDIQNNVGKAYKAFSKLFLPIGSIEKYLLKVITDPSYKQIKKEINDHFFYIESLDSILADYYKNGDNNGKHLYQKLRANLEKRRISEDAFIKDLCPIIMKHTNFTSFETSLAHLLS